ncbi:TPA: DUF551 domain-containing protein [Klebsiella variicola]
MTSKLTRERLAEIAQFGFSSAITPANDFEIKELARMALAAMDSEPVAYIDKQWTLVYYVPPMSMGLKIGDKLYRHAQPAPASEPVTHTNLAKLNFYSLGASLSIGLLPDGENADEVVRHEDAPLYRHAQPAPMVMQSEPAIADCDPEVYEKGVSVCLVAIPKETAEIICQNITAATGCKVDWHYFGGRVHIKALRVASQPAPVVPEEVTAEDCPAFVKYDVTEVDEAWARGFNSCRAAMLAAAPQSPGSEPATVPGKWIPVSERVPENKPGSYEYLVFETLNNRVNHDYWNVPDKGDDAFAPFWNYYGGHVTHWMPLPAVPQEVKGD